MAVKKCCVDNCSSCSTRKEDDGVTYHKFPKDVSLCDLWTSVTHRKPTDTATPAYVCSRHFCKSDFQIYKDSKYILKSDAIPSIFPWGSSKSNEIKMDVVDKADAASKEANAALKEADAASKEAEAASKIDEINVSTSSRESEGENVDAIKKFIEDQEKIISEKSSPVPMRTESNEVIEQIMEVKLENKQNQEETIEGGSSVIDGIIHSEAEIEKRDIIVKSSPPSDKVKSSMALSIGSKVEAKDFSEDWYSAEIVEVDYEEMEVLVHFENDNKK